MINYLKILCVCVHTSTKKHTNYIHRSCVTFVWEYFYACQLFRFKPESMLYVCERLCVREAETKRRDWDKKQLKLY